MSSIQNSSKPSSSLAEEPPFRNENDFRKELSNEMPARWSNWPKYISMSNKTSTHVPGMEWAIVDTVNIQTKFDRYTVKHK